MLRNKDGNTLLHFAAKNKSAEFIKKLISDGEEVNAINKDGETALDIAERYRNVEAETELIVHGARSKTFKG
jgi:ankyrin repeat protein